MSGSVLLLEAIGYIDEDVLERSEKKVDTKKNAWIGWAVLAACICLICVSMWGYFSPVKSLDNAMPEVADSVEEKPSLDMNGSQEAAEDYETTTSNLFSDQVYGALTVRFAIVGGSAEQEPSAIAINNLQQFEEYLAADEMGLASVFSQYSLWKYDEAFFDENQLIILGMEGNSSSVSYVLRDILLSENGWIFCIERQYPESGFMTSNIVYCHALIEAKAGLIGEDDQIIIQYSDRLVE